MGIPIKLEVFEGPLDLLLNLIEKNKIDIYDIPIVLITQQYLEYIKKMKTKDMDIMSEFLVMAATLVHIKSKMLLPKEEPLEEEEDPRTELVQRLMEYKMYKCASFELRDKQLDASKVVFKNPSLPEEIAAYKEVVDLDELLSELTLYKLKNIFDSVMKKQMDKIDPIRSQFGTIHKEEINMGEQIVFIEEYAATHRRFSFRTLLENQQGKMYIIVTFLGILELMKVGILAITQNNIYDDIIITYREGQE